MSPTHTDNLKNNLSEAGAHFKQAAIDAGTTVRGMATATAEEVRLGRANLTADLADGAIASLAAVEEVVEAGSEQMDVLMDRGRDLVDSAADLIRERPIASFGAAFAAGWIIAKLARSGGNDK